MARIAGVDIPREKRVEIALTYIYGIGLPTSQRILAQTNVNPDTRPRWVARRSMVTDPPDTFNPANSTSTCPSSRTSTFDHKRCAGLRHAFVNAAKS